MKKVDSIIYARWVVPVRPREQVLENIGVVVDQGLIVGLFPRAECEAEYSAQEVVERPHSYSLRIAP